MLPAFKMEVEPCQIASVQAILSELGYAVPYFKTHEPFYAYWYMLGSGRVTGNSDRLVFNRSSLTEVDMIEFIKTQGRVLPH